MPWYYCYSQMGQHAFSDSFGLTCFTDRELSHGPKITVSPAAYDTLRAHFAALGTGPGEYDLILTGDLGSFGHAIVQDLFCKHQIDMTHNYQDCGMLLYDSHNQDMHAGGSGAGCSATVFCGYVLPKMLDGTFSRVLFAPTGALLSTVSTMQGESIPGICHAVELLMER